MSPAVDMDPVRDSRQSLLPALLWLAVGVAFLATAGVLGWAMLSLHHGQRPSFMDRTQVSASAEPSATQPGDRGQALILAGSGSNLPVTLRLAKAFEESPPGIRIDVRESIGSTGGIRAVRDGAIDLGLISRPLRVEESALGLRAVPYARVPVAVAAHPRVPDGGLTTEDLLAAYRGDKRSWSDGSPVVVLQRELGDSGHAAVGERLPAFFEINRQAYVEGRWRVLFSDAAMQRALQESRGAVGLLDLDLATEPPFPLRILALDGVVPSPSGVASGAYPFSKDLAFVCPAHADDRTNGFLRFVASPAGQEIIQGTGLLPLPGVAP